MHRFKRWREALDAAHSQAAVERVMVEYADTLKPILGVLPEECRKAIEHDDLRDAAVTLLQCELAYRGAQEIADLLHEIAHTYAAASLRLTWIRSETLAPKAAD